MALPLLPLLPLQYTLPKPSLITERAKMADMISISSIDICGEDDFRCPRLNGARLAVGKAGAIRSKRVDRLWIWEVYSFGDKFRIREELCQSIAFLNSQEAKAVRLKGAGMVLKCPLKKIWGLKSFIMRITVLFRMEQRGIFRCFAEVCIGCCQTTFPA